MKALTTTLVLFILTIIVCNHSMAQKVSFTNDGGLTIGLGAGKAYQKSDLDNSDGFGFDFVFGSQLYNKKNAFLSVDWKFRFLAGENKAYDLSIPTDNNASNIRYSFFTYDLELGLTLNRLRERTRIVLTGFAGAGITHGRTFADLYDGGNLETPLFNKAAFLPTAGVFAGYQISRSITAGIEFKTNFYLTEENSFVGINLDDMVVAGSSLDRNSYVSLGFRWNIRGSSSSKHQANNYYLDGTENDPNNLVYTHPDPDDTKTENPVHQLSLPKPSVNITDPASDSYHTVSNTHTLWAIVNNVEGSDNISFYQNGIPNNTFSYNPSTKIFIATVHLREGENSIRIKAANQSSTAEDTVTITLGNPPEVLVPAPQLEFTTPSGNAYSSSSGKINVTARDEAGQAERSTPIIYHQPVYREPVYQEPVNYEPVYHEPVHQEPVNYEPINNEPVYREPAIRTYPPEINIINPATYPHKTYQGSEELRATVLNVNSKESITLKFNGLIAHNFSFNNSTKVLTARVALRDGENILTIQAQNESGADVKEQLFIKEVKPCPRPSIRLIDPVQGQSKSDHQIYTLRARVQNISNSEQLRLTVNGKTVSYTLSNNLVNGSVPLIKGLNTLSLSAENECGEVKASARITYSPSVAIDPCITPKISFAINEVKRKGSTHELRGSVSGVNSKAAISLTVDGRADQGFQFDPVTGNLSASFKLRPGSHTVAASVNNDCGTDSKTESLKVEDEACGLRINPGNSSWQFCMVTPSGIFSREDLKNTNFSYSGPASSLYIMPIGGGGDAVVNGSPYPINSGQYYLFTGNLNVILSTKNQGAMGQWSVCIRANNAPVSGNGNTRPKSPCEEVKNGGSKGKGNRR